MDRKKVLDELIDMFRKHSQPVSSERFKKRNIENIQFDADIISSNSIAYYQEKMNEQRTSELSKQGDTIMNAIFSFVPTQTDITENNLTE